MTLSPRAYGVALVSAGVAIGIAVAALTGILAFGGWPAPLYPDIIAILGKTVIGGGLLLALVIVFLGIGGPLKRAKVGGKSFNIEVEGD